MSHPLPVKVSIIIPVYNAENYLVQCLDSLAKQTLEQIEIILINDCSTDQSGAICDRYASDDPRFVVVHNELNIRQGPSRNKGIEIARGEYVGFVDADDWVDPDYYEKLYRAAKSKNADIAKTEAIMVLDDQTRLPQPTQNQEIAEGLKKGKPLHLLFSYEHCTAIYRREPLIQQNIRYPDIRNAQDDVFLLYCTWHCPLITLINGTNYYYRQHQQSVTSIKRIPFFESTLQCFELQVDFLNTVNIEKGWYHQAFFKALYPVKIQLDRMPDMLRASYRTEYLQKATQILDRYKYGGSGKMLEYILSSFQDQDTLTTIQASVGYKVGYALTWLPSKVKKLLSSI